MIVKDELINKLKAFGLNTYESKLWMALLSKGVATAGELSDLANVPRSRSYDVLESLERKGFIMVKIGKPIKYVAVKPSEVLERVKRKIHSEAVVQEQLVESVKESPAFEELKFLHTQGIETVDSSDLTSNIKGRTNINNHIISSIKNAESTVLLVLTKEHVRRDIDVLRKSFSKAQKKAVKIQLLVPDSENIEEQLSILGDYAEIKMSDNIKGRFIVIDGKELTFMIMDDQNIHSKFDSAVWVNTEFFSSALQSMIMKVWESSKTFEKSRSVSSSKADNVSMS